MVGLLGSACGDDGSSASATQTETSSDTRDSTASSTATSASAGTDAADDSTVETESDGEPTRACSERDHAYDLPVNLLAASDSDPAITDVHHHLWLEPDGIPASRLFVYLPGTGGPPAVYRQILQNAAAGGYHALGLSYINDVAVNDLCSVLEPGCHEAVRREILTGEDTSPLVDIAPADSIEHRLVAALQHLGWDPFVTDGAPVWETIAFAGHSQGAGHAAFIARLHEVHRAVLFAGTEPADWTHDPPATPAERLWGFVHVDDPLATPVQISWNSLGIPGRPAAVDGAAPPFSSHQLQTASAETGGNPHGSIVTDLFTPQADGLPVYRDVWCTMIGP